MGSKPRVELCFCFLAILVSGCVTGLPTSSGGPPPVPLSYKVGPYEEYATVYAPAGTSAQHRQPAVILLHGGFFGDDVESHRMAQELARHGVVAAVPTYRGEKRVTDGRRSQGKIEFCGGEVDDALALIEQLRARPDVDGERIGLLGASHGGCIALQVAARDPHLRAVVTLSAPTEAAMTYRNLHDHPLTQMGFGGWLASRMQSWVGGNPESRPQMWAQRSPVYQARMLTMPIVLIHGTADKLVPMAEVCWLRHALSEAGRRMVERYFDKKGQPALLPARPLCAAASPVQQAPVAEEVQKRQAELPPAEIWFYEGQGHTFGRAARDAAHERALRFLLDELLPEKGPAAPAGPG